ncbi:hypothetical protein CY35_16G083400 [Sphagnum magellanicum]|nr:hypothetical protein CY35_16G083400 [Sphagnum magellanicum]
MPLLRCSLAPSPFQFWSLGLNSSSFGAWSSIQLVRFFYDLFFFLVFFSTFFSFFICSLFSKMFFHAFPQKINKFLFHFVFHNSYICLFISFVFFSPL